MPHQCVHCGKIYSDTAEELLKGCSCGSHFFFFIKKEQLEKPKQIIALKPEEKKQIEKDVREIIGVEEEEPIILDFESVRIVSPGKYEIDLVNLFKRKRPVVYKLEEGKYIIDLGLTFKNYEKKGEKLKF